MLSVSLVARRHQLPVCSTSAVVVFLGAASTCESDSLDGGLSTGVSVAAAESTEMIECRLVPA